ncbi:MAG: MFS transporter [Verrucomicrobiae bacterium]|nr:MFS transporter [Verrucomicrobiae bacterium]
MTSENKPSKIRYLVLTLAASTSLMLYLHRYTWNIIRPQLEKEYGFTNTQLETIFTAFNFSYAAGQLPGGVICDFFGARVYLTSLIAGWSLGLILFATAGTYLTFISFRIIYGALQAGGYPGLSKVSRSWFPLEHRTTMQGFVASFAGRLGGAISPIIMATVLMYYMGFSWRTALVIMAFLGLGLAGAFFLLFRNSPYTDKRVNAGELALFETDRLPESRKKKVLNFWKAAKHRSYMTMIVAQLSNAGADIVYTSVMGSFFVSKGIDLKNLGFLVALPMFGGAIGGLFGGYLNDLIIRKTGNRKWARRIMGFSGKAIAAIFVFLAIAQSNVYLLGAGLFVVKFFSDWSQPTVWGTCTDMGGSHSATVFSMVNTAGNVGAIIVSMFMIGPLLDMYTTIELVNGVETRTTDFFPMFVMVAALYVMTAVLWLTIDCTKPVDPEGD